MEFEFASSADDDDTVAVIETTTHFLMIAVSENAISIGSDSQSAETIKANFLRALLVTKKLYVTTFAHSIKSIARQDFCWLPRRNDSMKSESSRAN